VSQHRQHAYIRRHGRTTKAQARALEQWLESYLIEPERIRERAGAHPVGIEIGFGMGQALLQWAAEVPAWHLFGVELYQPGIGSLVGGLRREALSNVSVVRQPAQEVVTALDDACVQEVRIFFPDPWPKKRHHKRRLIQPDFVAHLARILTTGGVVRIATDWAAYAVWMREIFAAEPRLALRMDQVRAAIEPTTAPTGRVPTKFEQRGEGLGHDIHDLAYTKLDAR